MDSPVGYRQKCLGFSCWVLAYIYGNCKSSKIWRYMVVCLKLSSFPVANKSNENIVPLKCKV